MVEMRVFGIVVWGIVVAFGCSGEGGRAVEELGSGKEVGEGLVFVDRTEAAGVDFGHRSGERVKNYIVEAKGGGAAFFDYDGDGYLDIYLVNGARLGKADTLRNALYRNKGDGTFGEVTREVGVGDSGVVGLACFGVVTLGLVGVGSAVFVFDNDATSLSPLFCWTLMLLL